MKPRHLLACFSVIAVCASATCFAIQAEAKEPSLAKATIAMTSRRLFAETRSTGWSGMGVYLWSFVVGATKALPMTYVCETASSGSLYYIDLTTDQISAGYLFLDAEAVNADCTPNWGCADNEKVWLKSINAPAIADWKSADVYLISGNYGHNADVESSHSTTLSEEGLATLLSLYTTCASDASYLNGVLAYPQLAADFGIASYSASATSVPSTKGGERNGTTVGEKVLSMQSQYAIASEMEESFSGIRVFCDPAWTNVYAWNGEGAITANWPGNALTVGSKWNTYAFDGMSSLNLIFNDGSSQTADLSINASGTYYYCAGTWFDEDPSFSSGTDGLRILHCFDWSLANIEANLADIKKAGFDAVQTSPLQRPVDYDPYYAQYESVNWWKPYQPLSFDVADTEWFGDESDLRSLTEAADLLGLEVIVDVVANHMADNGSDDDVPNPGIETYEPEIYADKANTFHSYLAASDDSIEQVVRGNIGMPDLNTANATVQGAVYDYLKQLIDDGVDGFRFDAAKHIETSEDGEFASDFWENTFQAAKSYAGANSIFAYGEILSSPGTDRSFSDYIDHAGLDAITCDSTGNDVAYAISNGNAISSSTYSTGLSAYDNVLWAESHDTYMNDNGISKDYDQSDVDSAYALLAAREDANLLYFCRPSGTIGAPNASKPWNSDIVKAANAFHEDMDGACESHSSTDEASVVERYGKAEGAVIVNPSASPIEVSLPHIQNGTYIDLIGGSSYPVSSHALTILAGTTLILEAQ